MPKRRRSEAIAEKLALRYSSRWSDDKEPDDPEWMDGTGYDDPDAYWDDDRVREAEDRQHWEAFQRAREAHDLEFMLFWEQELQELGHLVMNPCNGMISPPAPKTPGNHGRYRHIHLGAYVLAHHVS